MKKKVMLACMDCSSRNYTTEINRENLSERFEIKKFCKRCNAHTNHKETK